ncbi:MAG TPA: type 4a pilus biogenesis protein PilO [Gemmatimonadaceae bacterium]|jgi:type IV pilus assembly protein PilO|nr:type 4a pilus biogenesis protein PilO [Gemmatimonadaceae bacterium]
MLGMPKGQREQSLVLVGIVAVAAIALYWYLVYNPRAADLAKQEDHLAQLATLNQKAKAELAKGDLNLLRSQLADYQQNLQLVRTLVPTSNEVPALLEQVSTAARRVGLDLAEVDPQPVQPGTNYDTYRYGISIVGGYHDLAQFFTNVGSMTRIVLPVNVSLDHSTNQNAQKFHSKPNAAVIEAKFQIQTFVVRDGSNRAPAPTSNGAKS